MFTVSLGPYWVLKRKVFCVVLIGNAKNAIWLWENWADKEETERYKRAKTERKARDKEREFIGVTARKALMWVTHVYLRQMRQWEPRDPQPFPSLSTCYYCRPSSLISYTASNQPFSASIFPLSLSIHSISLCSHAYCSASLAAELKRAVANSQSQFFQTSRRSMKRECQQSV